MAAPDETLDANFSNGEIDLTGVWIGAAELGINVFRRPEVDAQFPVAPGMTADEKKG